MLSPLADGTSEDLKHLKQFCLGGCLCLCTLTPRVVKLPPDLRDIRLTNITEKKKYFLYFYKQDIAFVHSNISTAFFQKFKALLVSGRFFWSFSFLLYFFWQNLYYLKLNFVSEKIDFKGFFVFFMKNLTNKCYYIYYLHILQLLLSVIIFKNNRY